MIRRHARPAEQHFKRWYVRTGTDWLEQRVSRLAKLSASRPTRIEVRDPGYGWGSCGKGGNLYFNWRVLQLPMRLVDYVVMHELVHLREGHHGPAFWAALGRSMPDWEHRKSTLAGKAKDYLVFGLSVHGDIVHNRQGD